MQFLTLNHEEGLNHIKQSAPIMNVLYNPLSESHTHDVVIWAPWPLSLEALLEVNANLEDEAGCFESTEERDESIAYNNKYAVATAYDMSDPVDRDRYLDDLKTSGWKGDHYDWELLETQVDAHVPDVPSGWWR